jgi:hypothetical protein
MPLTILYFIFAKQSRQDIDYPKTDDFVFFCYLCSSKYTIFIYNYKSWI